MAIGDIAPTNNYVPNSREKTSPGQDVPSTSTYGQHGAEPQDQVPPSSQDQRDDEEEAQASR